MLIRACVCAAVTVCRDPRCAGDRIEYSGRDGLRLVCPHHKSAVDWDGMPVSCELPEDMVKVMMPYIKYGHSLLLPPRVKAQRYLFFDKQGRQMSSSHMSNWWTSITSRFATGFGFPAERLRHIWTTSLADRKGVTTRQRAALARIMGHTLATEDRVYDQHLPQRTIQESLAVAKQWRQDLLAA